MILFGEYGVISGGEILATTVSDFYGEWVLDPATNNDYWKKILSYFEREQIDFLDLNLLHNDIAAGLIFDSNIKSGYGMGSSGAFTAAIYDRYAPSPSSNITILQKQLAQIESCFHGTSSGIDPLTIYLNKPITVKNKIPQILDEPINTDHFFLIDTEQPRKTIPLVNQYLEKIKTDTAFAAHVDHYNILSSQAIQQLIEKDYAALAETFHLISQWQYQHLSFAVPKAYKQQWEDSLEDPSWSIKLCGAGGGGYLMGFSL